MTSSAGCRGLIRFASPPSAAIASRMAARSTTEGTPVKSWSRTRLGEKAISRLGVAFASHHATASTSPAVTTRPSRVRSKFSRRILIE